MRTFRLLTVAMLLALFFSACKKEDPGNQPLTKPKLLSPAKGVVVAPDKIDFTWEKSTDAEGEFVNYTLAVSNDSIVWTDFYCRKELFFTLFNDSNKGLSYPFEYGKKYYWKVIAKSYDGTGLIGSTESNVASFYTSPLGVSQLSETSGDGFVNLSWTDPEGLSKVEVTFSPAVSGIAQPLVVKPGVGKLELRGMENSTVYSFYVKAFNGLGHTSGTDTIKAMPLLPILVHDADFNIYSTVKIGTQTWLRENLRTTRWQDGTLMDDYRLLYHVGSQSSIYGNYYHVKVTNNSYNGKNPCPRGYHIPTDDDWKTLERYLGMSEADIDKNQGFRGVDAGVGFMLKSETGWNSYNGVTGNGSDLYGFNLLPAGECFALYSDNGSVEDAGEIACMAVSTNFVDNGKGYRIFRNDTRGNLRYHETSFLIAPSIRCVKD